MDLSEFLAILFLTHGKYLFSVYVARSMAFQSIQVTDKGYVQCISNPGELENGGLFLQLGLPSTLSRQENGVFRKRSSNRRNLKTPGFRFCVDREHFENTAFRKRWRDDNVWCVFRVKPLFKNFSGEVWTENFWCVFRAWNLRFEIPPAKCGRNLNLVYYVFSFYLRLFTFLEVSMAFQSIQVNW